LGKSALERVRDRLGAVAYAGLFTVASVTTSRAAPVGFGQGLRPPRARWREVACAGDRDVIAVEGSATVRLRPHQGYTVPRGIRHKTSAPERTVILMVEPAAVVPMGD
jgi:hypothetical protein